MGLDIYLRVENQGEFIPTDYYYDMETRARHRLSRIFCNFMCRRIVSTGESELDQIGRITSIDIKPIYAMENYSEETGEAIAFLLDIASSEKEKQMILDEAKQSNEKLRGNLDKVLLTVNALIEKLSTIENLPKLLNSYGHDTIGYDEYFIDFNIDKGSGYIDNNFGQDLRNFKRFLEYAKDKGATTVYFQYG